MPNPGQFIVTCRIRITTDYINSKTELQKTIENLINKIYDFFFYFCQAVYLKQLKDHIFDENIKQNK